MAVDNSHRYFTVCRHQVLEAVSWLKTNNPYFKDVEIDQVAIESLPENGIPSELRYLESELCPNENVDEGPAQEPLLANDMNEEPLLESVKSSFMPQGQRQRKDEDAIRETVNEKDSLEWPSIEGNVVNLKQMVWPPWHFLLCFLLGKVIQPAGQDSMGSLSLKDLIKFAERLPDGKYRWRFGFLIQDFPTGHLTRSKGMNFCHRQISICANIQPMLT